MLRTKKEKILAIAILIIVFAAGAFCSYALLARRSDAKQTVQPENGTSYANGQQPDNGMPTSPGKHNPKETPPPATNPTQAETGDQKPTEPPADTPTPTPTPKPDSSLVASGNGEESISIPPAPTENSKPLNSPETGSMVLDPAADKTATDTDTLTLPPTPTAALQPTDTALTTVTDIPTVTTKPTVTAPPADNSKPTKIPAKSPVLTGMDSSVSANGQLKVIGTKLSNANGDPITLRGISTHGIAWFPDFATKSFMQTLRDEWGASVFRIAMYSFEGNDSYINNPSWNKTKVCGLIDAAIELDLYVIVDWHILADGNPQTYQKQAAEFFTYIASTYPGVPNILYEICNEPNGGTSWSGNIKPYANAIIPVIREYSPEAVILVGTPTWSQDVDAAAADPLSFDNVMYSLHFYAGTHKEWLRNKADTALSKGLALFATEWGTTDASGNGAVDKSSTNEWLTYLEKNGISWCNWSLCNKAESSALLLPSAQSGGAMPDSSLTESGKYVKEKMLEYSGTTPVEQKPQEPTQAPSQKTTPTPAPTISSKDPSEENDKTPSSQKPSASDKTGLTLLYYNENRDDSTNTISPRFQIKNNTGSDISLDKLTIRYYYTPEKDIAQCFFCDYAEVNGTSYRAITSALNGTFVTGENSGMEITFTSDAGTLAPGDTATLQIRITNEDWSNYLQSNDASFLKDATTYTESSNATLITK
ncbi:MAG: cellulase family glycosylhydrolase [Lachnospiraceae bacterium]|nr:cellulase family glycosylhydrolase [Lachnospiraceae bacterium]